ncbi:hypothetical protein CPC16_002799 [Podila verticillata]|nr:hypothetical protein CPC16_002799 [Podila verticillata]
MHETTDRTPSTDAPLIDLSFPGATPVYVTSQNGDPDSGSGDDDEDDNISLGSVDTESGPNTLPPTYDLASILGNAHAAAAAANGDTKPSNESSSNGRVATDATNEGHGRNTTTSSSNGARLPVNIPSTAEMENLPNDVVAQILETLTVLELFDLHTLSERWRQLTTRALLDKFTQLVVVLWIDQEGHRAFRPELVFDSFDEATNRIRWLPKPTSRPEKRGQVYSKTFGITKPIIRIISVGNVDKFDYLDKEAQITIQKPGTRTLLGSDKGCPWAMIYKVSSFTRKGKKVNGERWIEPISFECHLDFLNPRRAHKLRLLWYLQKSYGGVAAGSSAGQKVARTKVEGAMSGSEMTEFFNGNKAFSTASMPAFR